MAKLSELVPAAAAITGVPEKSVAMYARVLREARYISTGGRGPGAADMTAADCAALIIALIGAEHAVGAGDAVILANGLMLDEVHCRPSKEGGVPPQLRFLNRVGLSFSTVVVELFSRAQRGTLQECFGSLQNPILRIEMASPLPHAMITVSEIINDDSFPIYFGDFRVSPFSPEDVRKHVEHHHKNTDFRINREVSHKTIFALGELIRA